MLASLRSLFVRPRRGHALAAHLKATDPLMYEVNYALVVAALRTMTPGFGVIDGVS